jgi:ribosome-binding factor A
MRTTHRREKGASLLREEISKILLLDVRDPALNFVSVTGVNMSSDLRTAIVYVSIFGNAEQKRKAMAALNRGKGYFRKIIASRVNLKYNPNLIFELDESLEKQAKIDEILTKIKNEERYIKEDSRKSKKK